MILFLSFELKIISTCLLEIIVQPEFIESCKCARQLKEISLTDKTKFLLVDKINNGFSVDVCGQQTSIQCNHIVLDKGVQKRCPAFCNPNVVKIVWKESIRICSALMCKYFWPIKNVSIAKRKAAWEIQSSFEVFHWPRCNVYSEMW